MKYLRLVPWWFVLPVLSFVFMFWVLFTLPPSPPFSDPMWEIVHTPRSSEDVIRTAVPHGWLVMYKRLARGIVYVPDEGHEWKVES